MTLRLIAFAALVTTAAFGQLVERDSPQSRAARRTQQTIRKALQSRRFTSAQDTPTGPVTVVIRQPSDWTLTTKACPALKSDLKGSGEDKITVTITPNDDGSYLIETLDSITGTASDAAGNAYVFVYNNTITIDSYPAFTLEPPVPPFEFHGPDTFQLIGSATAPGYTIGQYFRLLINADGSVTDKGTGAAGNPDCDPI